MCIDFSDLNATTPKDEYHMLVTDMLVDSTTYNEILSLLDGYLGYNQIYIKMMYLKLLFDAQGHWEHTNGR